MSLRLVLLGPPASGKGTLGRRLSESLDLDYLGTGAMLRSAVEAGSELGLSAKPYLDRGEYLPDEIMCPLMGEWLAKREGGWILDGFPRSEAQAKFLSEWLSDRDLALDAAILLEVPEAVLLRRIRGRVECPECRWSGRMSELTADRCPECGGVAVPRADDNESNFRSRLSEYQRVTLPAVEYYASGGLLHRCDATDSPEEATARMLELIRDIRAHGQAA